MKAVFVSRTGILLDLLIFFFPPSFLGGKEEEEVELIYDIWRVTATRVSYISYITRKKKMGLKFLSFHFVVKMVLRTSFRKYQSNKFCCLKFCINESSFDNFIFLVSFKYNDCEKTKKGIQRDFRRKK